jgi:folate-binding protein YgfZ
MDTNFVAVSPIPLDTPLAGTQQREGARPGAWFGCRLPDSFGDWREDYRAARESVAVLDKNYRCHFSLTGPDRVRYMNAILTDNIRDLAPRHGSIGLLLNPQGRIQAELETRAEDGRLFCVSYAMIREKLAAAIEKFIIMDDVTLEDVSTQFGTLALEGPHAAEAVGKLTGVELDSLAELESTSVHIASKQNSGEIAATLVRRSPGGKAGAELLLQRTDLEAAWSILRAAAKEFGGGPAGYEALNALRLEQGAPWFGYDFGDAQIPHEAGLQDSHISYTKGCYTGQEIVERVRSRGHVNRARVLVKLRGEAPQAGESLLDADGKPAGSVTRSAVSPEMGCPIAMAYVRREHASIGSTLAWSGGTAEVVAPPLAAPQK